MEISAILAKTDLFSGLDASALALIAPLCQKRPYKTGEVIFEEGVEGQEIFIVPEGRVAIELRIRQDMTTEQIHQVKDYEVFGELCLVGGHRRSARTRALENLELLVIGRDGLKRAMDADPSLGYRVMQNLAGITAGKLRDTNIALRNIIMQQRYVFGG